MNLQTLAIQPTSEQPIADEKPKVSYHLSGDVFISIHTKKAQSLCQGSWEYNRMGLFQFAAVMTGIYQAHRLDDLYADWIIKKIEEKLKVIDAAIKEASLSCNQALQQFKGLEVQIFGSLQPLKIPLEFAVPLSYLAACTILDLDFLLRQAYTFRRLGIIPESQEAAYHLFGEMRTH